eukprot:3890332-Rhodomonas_salina.2
MPIIADSRLVVCSPRIGYVASGLYPLNPTNYTLNPTSYTLHPIPYTLHPMLDTDTIPCTLHPVPYTLYPFTLYPIPMWGTEIGYAATRRYPPARGHHHTPSGTTLCNAGYWHIRSSAGRCPVLL